MSHRYSRPFPAFQPANESYPVIQCHKCKEVFENSELDYCPKWWKKTESDFCIDDELDLPF